MGLRLRDIFFRRGQSLEIGDSNLLLAGNAKSFPLDARQVFVDLGELVLEG